jgi:hypothetical protein
MPIEVKDILGQPITVGSRIAIAEVSGRSSASLRIAVVEEITQSKAGPWLHIRYTTAGAGWMANPRAYRTRRLGAVLCLPS